MRKTKSSFISILSCLLLLAILTGCSNTSIENSSEVSSSEVTESSTESKAEAGETGATKTEKPKIIIKAEANPTTGFTWDVWSVGSGKMKISEKECTEEHNDTLGKPHEEIFTLTPIVAGDIELYFNYLQNWDNGENAFLIAYEFTINEDLSVEYKGSEKILIDSETEPAISEPEITK